MSEMSFSLLVSWYCILYLYSYYIFLWKWNQYFYFFLSCNITQVMKTIKVLFTVSCNNNTNNSSSNNIVIFLTHNELYAILCKIFKLTKFYFLLNILKHVQNTRIKNNCKMASQLIYINFSAEITYMRIISKERNISKHGL